MCDRKGQWCHKYPTQKFIDEYDPTSKPSPLFGSSGGGKKQANPEAVKGNTKTKKKGGKKKGKDEL